MKILAWLSCFLVVLLTSSAEVPLVSKATFRQAKPKSDPLYSLKMLPFDLLYLCSSYSGYCFYADYYKEELWGRLPENTRVSAGIVQEAFCSSMHVFSMTTFTYFYLSGFDMSRSVNIVNFSLMNLAVLFYFYWIYAYTDPMILYDFLETLVVSRHVSFEFPLIAWGFLIIARNMNLH